MLLAAHTTRDQEKSFTNPCLQTSNAQSMVLSFQWFNPSAYYHLVVLFQKMSIARFSFTYRFWEIENMIIILMKRELQMQKLTISSRVFSFACVQSKYAPEVQLLTMLLACHLTHQVNCCTLILILQRILFQLFIIQQSSPVTL